MSSPNHIQNHFEMHNFFPPYPPSPTAASAAAFFPSEPHSNIHPNRTIPYPSPALHPNAGPQILALLNKNSNNNLVGPCSSSTPDSARRFLGDYVPYDVDAVEGRREPEQLEATPITKYGSDPGLVIGRQIAVNMHYVCYGLKCGNVRILNPNAASRSLLRGHSKRVTDMAFYADDVHLLATVSLEGLVYVWKIYEGPDNEDRPQITGNVVTAIQFLGGEAEGDYAHPRVCWHCNNRDVLVVGIGKCVLRIDAIKVNSGEGFSDEAPLRCSVDGLINGVQLVGRHDGEVTDLSICQWATARMVSASTDGTIKIWEDGKAAPITVLKPHGGQPVTSAQLMTAPHQTGHIMIVTAGHLNREVKIWALASEEEWRLPNHPESWKCTQTLDLKSSAEPRVEEAFFNQVVVLSQAGLLLIANAKRKTIYSVHLDYGSNPMASHIDYIAEFAVNMPILSLTGMIAPGEHMVKLYCVQTMAIQQYSLDLCQFLPPPTQSVGLERAGSSVLHDAGNAEGFAALDANGNRFGGFLFPSFPAKPSCSETTTAVRYPLGSTSLEASTLQENMTSNMECKPISLELKSTATNVAFVASPPIPLSPRLSRNLSGFRNPTISSDLGTSGSEHAGNQSIIDYSVDRQMDTTCTNFNMASLHNDAKSDEKKNAANDTSKVLNPSMMFKHPTHLITPSEILMSASSSETTSIIEGKNEEDVNIQQVIVNSDVGNAEVEGVQEVDGAGRRESLALSLQNDMDGKVSEPAITTTGAPRENGKRQEKTDEATGQYSPSGVFNIANLSNEDGGSSSLPAVQAVFSQVISMQNMLNQLMAMQKDLQKQMSNLVTLPVTKEGKRLEAALGRSIEKAVKTSTDALWARLHEENAKNEKLLRDRTQKITSLITNLVNKDLTTLFEKVVKKELPAVGTAIVRTITPSIEKTITSAIAESFQRGVADKVVNQLERSVNSRLEATVGRQIQAQFQTTGKHALQDAMKSSMEASVIPAFEKSCKTMFGQVDATFQKGMLEHTTAALQHFESANSPLAIALRDSISSASSMVQTLNGEFVDGQRKLISLAAGGNKSAVNPLVPQVSNGPLHGLQLHEKVEAALDPTKDLSRLISDRKYEEAFTAALQRSDLSIVSWLCSQVDLRWLLSMVPAPLSQGVLLALVQQLAYDINSDTSRKLAWITDVSVAINPADPTTAVHARPVFEQVYQKLHHQSCLPTTTAAELSSIRLLMHVINSTLMTCK